MALYLTSCVDAKLFQCVQLFVTLWIITHQASLSMECPLSILQARILEWVAMPSSRGSSRPRIEPMHYICIGRRVLYH